VIILRSVPKGYNWGWFSREDPRMHLQTVDAKHRNEYKVWLEAQGKRVFDPVGSIPSKVLRPLDAEVKRARIRVEAQWVSLMIANDWLTFTMQGSVITLIAYPGFPGGRFTRTVDLADYLQGIYSPTSQMWPKIPVKPEEVGLNGEIAALEIWTQKHESARYHISLPEILWQD
jgi:hypothetical protein